MVYEEDLEDIFYSLPKHPALPANDEVRVAFIWEKSGLPSFCSLYNFKNELVLRSPNTESYGYTDKIYKFLFETEFKDVPLYINDKTLKPYVHWRLQNNK